MTNSAVFACVLRALALKHIETRTDGKVLYLIGGDGAPFSRTFSLVLDRHFDDLVMFSSRDMRGLPGPCWMCQEHNYIEDALGEWRCISCDPTAPVKAKRGGR